MSSSATRRSLEHASAAGDRSIGFPALATGVAGFPIDECAEAMVGAVREFERDRPGAIDLVRFVVRGDDDRAVFERAIG